MTTIIEVIEKASEYTIQKRVDCTVMKMPSEIKNTYKEIVELLQKNGRQASGMPFVKYLDIDWAALMKENMLIGFFKMFFRKWHIIIGFPVAEKFEPGEPLASGILEGGKYIKTVHYGPYQNVTAAYKELVKFAEKENIKMKNESIEIYTNDPAVTKKEELETILLVPVAG